MQFYTNQEGSRSPNTNLSICSNADKGQGTKLVTHNKSSRQVHVDPELTVQWLRTHKLISEVKGEIEKHMVVMFQTLNEFVHTAALNGNLEVLRLLLHFGASPIITDNGGSQPIHEAAAGGHVSIMNLLQRYGAGVNSRDGCGCTPLHHAAKGGHVDSVSWLIQRYDKTTGKAGLSSIISFMKQSIIRYGQPAVPLARSGVRQISKRHACFS
eukprot:Gb_15529 [translate_table: standard]